MGGFPGRDGIGIIGTVGSAPLDVARDLVALTEPVVFTPRLVVGGDAARSPTDERLDAVATAAVAHCRRLIGAVVRLAATGLDDAAGPLARAVFEAAVPVLWTLGDPPARAARYFQETGHALARLTEAAAREGVALPEPVARAPLYRRITRGETLPSLDRMARGIGLSPEDVIARRTQEAIAHGAFAAGAEGSAAIGRAAVPVAVRVFALLAVAAARRVGADAAAIEECAAALGVGNEG